VIWKKWVRSNEVRNSLEEKSGSEGLSRGVTGWRKKTRGLTNYSDFKPTGSGRVQKGKLGKREKNGKKGMGRCISLEGILKILEKKVTR